jgi:hypothetical protein
MKLWRAVSFPLSAAGGLKFGRVSRGFFFLLIRKYWERSDMDRAKLA